MHVNMFSIQKPTTFPSSVGHTTPAPRMSFCLKKGSNFASSIRSFRNLSGV